MKVIIINEKLISEQSFKKKQKTKKETNTGSKEKLLMEEIPGGDQEYLWLKNKRKY